MENSIYFDHAATAPMLPEVVEHMCEIMRSTYGNPSSVHATGRKAKSLIENCRSRIAKILNCTASEIIFTGGGTETDNMVLKGAVHSLGVKTIISSKIEHHAVLDTAEFLHKNGAVNLVFVNLLENGHVDLLHLEELLKQHSNVLVSLMHANNEIGNFLDIEKVGELCHSYNACFHSDTVQSMGNYQFDLSKSNVDFLAAAAHKFNGPKGIGFIYVSKKNKLSSLINGGGQERGYRAGTENVAGIAGMCMALEIAYANLEKKREHVLSLKHKLANLLTQNFSEIKFNGDTLGNALCNVLSVSFPPIQGADMLLFNLDLEGIAVSGGSACSSGAVGGSHVINTIGDPTRTTVRFSFGASNTEEEIEVLIEKLKKWIPQQETISA